MTVARFMATGVGRGVRIVVGVALIGVGLGLSGWLGLVSALVGLVFVTVGATNVCLIAPILGAPVKGSACQRAS